LRFPKKPFYKTAFGSAYLGDALDFLPQIPDGTINLIVTSPPYALHFKKEYGNVDKDEYISWFLRFAKEFHRVLADDGSLVINVGGSYHGGEPTRSLYHFRLLIELCDTLRFRLAQEFFWYNPAKLPAPAEWVTVRRIRVKDSVECVWWLAKGPFPKADNREVLQPYSKDMRRLVKKGYRAKLRPSGHNITKKFQKDLGGSIPSNLLEYAEEIPSNLLRFGNNASNDSYTRACKEEGIKIHPARFPAQLPLFFVKFLTTEGDLVLDPFAGSNTTGAVAEQEKRHWLAFETEEEYLRASKFRFVRLADETTAITLHKAEDLPLFTAKPR
jgi:site-specific DNA-methyltransferase (cytosine-N4-specific)